MLDDVASLGQNVDWYPNLFVELILLCKFVEIIYHSKSIVNFLIPQYDVVPLTVGTHSQIGACGVNLPEIPNLVLEAGPKASLTRYKDKFLKCLFCLGCLGVRNKLP